MKRLLVNEYKMMLPSYIILEKSLDAQSNYTHSDIMRLSKEAGADYVVICGIDGNKPPDKGYWYIALNQALFTADGGLLSISTFAKKVDPASGNIQAAGESILQARSELQKHLPFVATEYQMTLSGL